MICEQHGIEHTPKFPCGQYEQYRQMATHAHSVTVYETRVIEDPEREGLLGMERVEVGTYEAGHVGPAREGA